MSTGLLSGRFLRNHNEPPSSGLPPNDKQISWQRPEKTYGSLLPQGASHEIGALACSRLAAAFAG